MKWESPPISQTSTEGHTSPLGNEVPKGALHSPWYVRSLPIIQPSDNHFVFDSLCLYAYLSHARVTVE